MTTEIHAITTWFTAPGWTRAHQLEITATMGGRTYWTTHCGRDYPPGNHEFDEPTDEPMQAPGGMPGCRICLKTGQP